MANRSERMLEYLDRKTLTYLEERRLAMTEDERNLLTRRLQVAAEVQPAILELRSVLLAFGGTEIVAWAR